MDHPLSVTLVFGMLFVSALGPEFAGCSRMEVESNVTT